MRDIQIIADSCCDMTEQLKDRLKLVLVPLTMRVGEKEFLDDENLVMDEFMSAMRDCTGKTGSAAPCPQLYRQAIENAPNAFVLTLSGRLSGSYSNAVLGKRAANDDMPTNTYIFDTKSASAGETLVAIKIHELITQGISRENIISQVSAFISQMKTYFVLESYDNLLKNGRLNRIAGKVASILNIKLVMGSDGDGNIALYAKPRGINQTIERLLQLIRESGRQYEGENLVISHCNNPGLARRIAQSIKAQFKFKEIFVVPTGGISSLYADDKGIVMAF